MDSTHSDQKRIFLAQTLWAEECTRLLQRALDAKTFEEEGHAERRPEYIKFRDNSCIPPPVQLDEEDIEEAHVHITPVRKVAGGVNVEKDYEEMEDGERNVGEANEQILSEESEKEEDENKEN